MEPYEQGTSSTDEEDVVDIVVDDIVNIANIFVKIVVIASTSTFVVGQT